MAILKIIDICHGVDQTNALIQSFMRDFSIDLIWTKIQIAFTAPGGWLGYFLGGMVGLLIALPVFAVLDYVTGLMCTIADRKLSSAVGFRKSAERRSFLRWLA